MSDLDAYRRRARAAGGVFIAAGAPQGVKRSAWWFALPMVLGILGGVIAWSRTRDDDPDIAKWLMIVGIAQTAVIGVGITVASEADEVAMFETRYGDAAYPPAAEWVEDDGWGSCGEGYVLIGDICDVAPDGYVEARSECEMAVDSREAAGVEQDYMAELEKCRAR